MDTRDWSLILFTILVQMSAGAFIVLGVTRAFATRKYGAVEADRLSDRALLAIWPVLILGMIASFGHLGNPINAPRAVVNLGTSWLSREILLVVLFFLFGVVFAWLQWRKIASPVTRNILAGIAALLGLGLVFSMSRVYMLETQPAWNSPVTTIAFFTTALLLGSLGIGAAFVGAYALVVKKDPGCAEVQCELLRSSLRGIAVYSLLMLGVVVITIPLHVAFLAANPLPEANASAALLYGEYGLLLGLRLALVFLGAGFLALFVYQNALSPGRERILGNLTLAAFGLVLVAEVVGRLLFYATHVQITI